MSAPNKVYLQRWFTTAIAVGSFLLLSDRIGIAQSLPTLSASFSPSASFAPVANYAEELRVLKIRFALAKSRFHAQQRQR